MSREVFLSPQAVTDVGDALAFMHERNPMAAVALRVRIESTLEALADGRFHGREVRLSDGAAVHRWASPP